MYYLEVVIMYQSLCYWRPLCTSQVEHLVPVAASQMPLWSSQAGCGLGGCPLILFLACRRNMLTQLPVSKLPTGQRRGCSWGKTGLKAFLLWPLRVLFVYLEVKSLQHVTMHLILLTKQGMVVMEHSQARHLGRGGGGVVAVRSQSFAFSLKGLWWAQCFLAISPSKAAWVWSGWCSPAVYANVSGSNSDWMWV